LEYETVSSVYIPSNILPDSILNLLPLKPDSFRINFKTKFAKEVDAWGSLKLPAKTWDVQRERRVTNSQTTVDAKVTKPFPLGWIDVTALAAGIFAGFFGDLNTTSYAFVSNETKGLIALINMDTTGNPISIQYKPDDQIQVKTTEAGTANTIELLQNPVSDQLVVRLPNGIDAGSILHIYDAWGHLIMEPRVLDAGSSILDLNVNRLASGSYTLQIVQKNHQNRFRASFIKI
ncbi:MAG TPA: hypothetical protein VFX48_06010, partial [Saprospiraceae bacterium]|nr:hypothetical protein [Saprospiraceae bacterium]